MTRQIVLIKPDKSRSCIWCRLIAPPEPCAQTVWCKEHKRIELPEAAQSCPQFKDSRTTYQVISASGKAFA